MASKPRISYGRIENVKSLWKVFMPRVIGIFLGQITEHQGDSTNEHIPYEVFETLVALCYTTNRLDAGIRNLEVTIKK